MKTEFYKNYMIRFGYILILIPCFIVFTAVLVYSIYAKNSSEQIFVLSVAVAISIIPLFMLFFQKKLFSKIIFSELGVEWKHFQKQILFFKWEEITSVQEKAKSMAIVHFILYRSNEKIVIEASKKIYDSIETLCPISTLKLSIQNLKSYQLYKKRQKLY